jgi:hypothetical protein
MANSVKLCPVFQTFSILHQPTHPLPKLSNKRRVMLLDRLDGVPEQFWLHRKGCHHAPACPPRKYRGGTGAGGRPTLLLADRGRASARRAGAGIGFHSVEIE